MDVCGLQEVRWRGQGAHFIEIEERKYKLWFKEMMLKRVMWEYWLKRNCVRVLLRYEEEVIE